MDHARELTVLCSFITPGGEGQPNPQKLILALGTSGLSPCSLTGSPFGHLLTDFATDDELRATFVSDVWQSSPKFWFIVWCIQSVSLPVSVLELGTGSGVIRLLISLTREWFEHFKLWIILCLVYIYISLCDKWMMCYLFVRILTKTDRSDGNFRTDRPSSKSVPGLLQWRSEEQWKWLHCAYFH